MADTLRDSAKAAVAELHRRGLRTLIITGDQEATARAIAAELGIDDVHAGLLPEQKLAAIDAERAAGHTLAMVGDGVNDAPPCPRPRRDRHGSGTDIARESADVVLISSDLNDLAHTLFVAKRARRIVMFNFIGTIAVDLIGIGLAAFGLLQPGRGSPHPCRERDDVHPQLRAPHPRQTEQGGEHWSCEHPIARVKTKAQLTCDYAERVYSDGPTMRLIDAWAGRTLPLEWGSRPALTFHAPVDTERS